MKPRRVSVGHVTVKGGVLLEVNCETDFVARTEDFRTFAEKLADRIAAHDGFGDTRAGAPAEALALSWPGGETVQDARTGDDNPKFAISHHTSQARRAP